jgi:hypothetical protein
MRRALTLVLASILLTVGLVGCELFEGSVSGPNTRKFEYLDTLVTAALADTTYVVLEYNSSGSYAWFPPYLIVSQDSTLRDSLRLVLDVHAWDETDVPDPEVTLTAETDSLLLWYSVFPRDTTFTGRKASGDATTNTSPLPAPEYRIVALTVETPPGVDVVVCAEEVPDGPYRCFAFDERR